jgi:hypothetical protein
VPVRGSKKTADRAFLVCHESELQLFCVQRVPLDVQRLFRSALPGVSRVLAHKGGVCQSTEQRAKNMNEMMTHRQSIDEAAVALAHRGLFVTIKLCQFRGRLKIHVRCTDGRLLSVMTDLNTPVLYDVTVLDRVDQSHAGILGVKLPMLAMTELVMREAAK